MTDQTTEPLTPDPAAMNAAFAEADALRTAREVEPVFEKLTGAERGSPAVAPAAPSICRAVIVQRISHDAETGFLISSAPVPGVVQATRAPKDPFVIDCYVVGDLDIDGSGARGGMHELRGVKHVSLREEDGLFWSWPPRV